MKKKKLNRSAAKPPKAPEKSEQTHPAVRGRKPKSGKGSSPGTALTEDASRPARLTDEVKRFIVEHLASYWTPLEVAHAVKETYGIHVNRQSVEAYDPTKFTGRNLSQKYQELFETSRQSYLGQSKNFGIAHQVHRLDRLQQLLMRAQEMGNLQMALRVLEQAAKETGGLYTNKRILDSDPRAALAQLLGLAPGELPNQVPDESPNDLSDELSNESTDD